MPVCCLSWLMKSYAWDFVLNALTRSMEAKDSDLFTSASERYRVQSLLPGGSRRRRGSRIRCSPDEPSEIGFRARAPGAKES